MNIRKEAFIFIIILISLGVFPAYSGEIDSLKNRLESLSDQEKIVVLNKLAGAYWELTPNERIAFAEQAVDLSEEFHDYKSKADAFNHLGVAYNNLGDSPKSMDYFLKALKIMEQIDDKSGIADSYLNIGQANFYLNNFDKALEYFQKNLNLRSQIGDKKNISQALNTIGNVMSKMGKYDKALDYYFKALKISNEINDKMGISQLYNNIGNVYLESGEVNRVLEYRLKSLQIVRELGDKWEIALITYNIAEYFLLNKEPEKAYPYILESQKLAKYLENKGLIRDNLYNFSLYYELKGDYQKALKYQRDYAELTKNLFSEELFEKITEMQIKYETEKKEIENQTYKLQLEKARSLRLRLIIGLLIILIIAFFIYYRYWVKKKTNLLLEGLVMERTRELQQKINELKQTKTDLQKNEQFLTLLIESVQDGVSVLNPDMTIRLVNGVMKRWYAKNLPLEGKLCYQVYHNSDKPCDPCPASRCLKSGQTEYDIVPGLPGSPVEYIELFSYPMKDRNSGEITGVVEFVKDITERRQAENQIRKNLKEKEVLLKEIHHRVKNNLNIIISLLNLQARHINTKQQALDAFKESKNRIYAMSMVHEKLYQSDLYAEIYIKDYIETFARYLMGIYASPTMKIDQQISVDDLSIDINIAIPCGLILNELITNALKHAWTGRSKGKLKISFCRLKNKQYEMIVEDDGKGLPGKIDFTNPDSMGLQLITILTKQIDGVLTVHRQNGSRFQIVFPVSKGEEE